MYVCLCNGITDRCIRKEINKGASSIKDLSKNLGIATCCGRCAKTAKSMLKEHTQNSQQTVDYSLAVAV